MPEIFNTGQGSQFTGDSFTGVLIKNGITISMDGRGRALGNIFVERLWRTVKYEDVYLKKDENMPGLLLGLTHHFLSYNEERLHQSLGYTTPDVVYQTATGGGAKIVDKFSGSVNICLDRGGVYFTCSVYCHLQNTPLTGLSKIYLFVNQRSSTFEPTNSFKPCNSCWNM